MISINKSIASILIVLIVFSLNVFAASGPSIEIIGALKGKYNVSQGNFSYALALDMPKGANNFSPNLKIKYRASNQSNGILGLGFGLSGLSTIQRCKKDTKLERENTSSEYYCIDGEKLLQNDLSQSYGGESTTYFTKVNSYKKIVSFKESGSTKRFKVYYKNGVINEYGLLASHRLNSSTNIQDTIVFRISKKTDSFGNTINYHYSNQNISSIEYSNNTINFQYIQKDINTISYKLGSKLIKSSLLSNISISTNNRNI